MKNNRFTRRALLGSIAAGGAGLFMFGRGSAEVPAGNFPVRYSDAEWRRRLSRPAYSVLRQAATERPGSSPLNNERRRGRFHCAGCNNALFTSQTKFDSGTGWPSFYAPIRGAVGTRPDNGLFGARTEVHCTRCGGHLGHVFNDGPRPTGLRYCMNGAAMTFRAA